MADAAISVSKLLLEKLLYCKQQYDDLAEISEDLGDQLEQLLHLCEQRQREPRFSGAVQKHFSKRLDNLATDLEAIISKRNGSSGSKIVQFFGSLWGGGAARDLKSLQSHNNSIEKLLVKLQVESGTVTASAAEEIAGGTAAKFITSESMQKFWRSQFKNELKLSWDSFRETMLMIDDFSNTFPLAANSVISAVRGKMDRNGDDFVHVTEFASLFTSPGLPPHHNVIDVLRHHCDSSGSKRLLSALTWSPVDEIVCTSVCNEFFALASKDAYVKLYSYYRDAPGVTLVSQVSLAKRPSAVCVGYVDSHLVLIAAVDTMLEFYDAWSGSMMFTFECSEQARSVDLYGRTVFVTGLGVGDRVQVLGWTAGKVALESILPHFASVRSVCPLNEKLVLCATHEAGSIVWDYRSGTAILSIPELLMHPVLVDVAGGRFVVAASQRRSVISVTITLPATLEGSYSIKSYDIDDEIAAFGKHRAVKRRDQAVVVYEYTIGKDGTPAIPKTTKFVLPKCLDAVTVIPLESRDAVLVYGIADDNKEPTWLVYDTATKVPTAGTTAVWNPRTSNQHLLSWEAKVHPAVTISLSVDSQAMLSSLGGPTIRLHSVAIDGALELLHEQCLLSNYVRFSGHITAIALDAADVLVATSDGWILRYDFTTKSKDPDARAANHTAPALELGVFLENLRSLSTTNIRSKLRELSLLSGSTVTLVKKALGDKNFPVHSPELMDALDQDECERLRKTLINVHAQQLSEIVPTSSMYLSPDKWASPVDSRWICDGDDFCDVCKAILPHENLISQICPNCTATCAPLCVSCGEPGSSKQGLCETCYVKKKKTMLLVPQSLVVCGNFLIVGTCADNGFYGPAGGTLLKMELKSFKLIDRLSRSYVPFFSNIGAADLQMGNKRVHVFAAPISYCTIALFDCSSDSLLKPSILATISQQCLQSILLVPAMTSGLINVFSSTLNLDLAWHEALVTDGTTITARFSCISSIKNDATIFTKLSSSGKYLFASDKLGATTVFDLENRSLQQIVRVQAQGTKLTNSLFCNGVFLTPAPDGTIGVLPLSRVTSFVDATRTASAISAVGMDRSSLIAVSDGKLNRLDKHWKWRVGADEPFSPLNDVQKVALSEAVVQGNRVEVRRPGQLQNEAIELTNGTMTLQPSNTELVRVREYASERLTPPKDQTACFGTENIVHLNTLQSQSVRFDLLVQDIPPQKRIFVAIRVFHCKPASLIEVSIPLDDSLSTTVEIADSSSLVWFALGSSGRRSSQSGNLVLNIKCVDGEILFQRTPAIQEKRSLDKSPVLYIEI